MGRAARQQWVSHALFAVADFLYGVAYCRISILSCRCYWFNLSCCSAENRNVSHVFTASLSRTVRVVSSWSLDATVVIITLRSQVCYTRQPGISSCVAISTATCLASWLSTAVVFLVVYRGQTGSCISSLEVVPRRLELASYADQPFANYILDGLTDGFRIGFAYGYAKCKSANGTCNRQLQTRRSSPAISELRLQHHVCSLQVILACQQFR